MYQHQEDTAETLRDGLERVGVAMLDDLPEHVEALGVVTADNLPAHLEAADVLTTDNLPAHLDAAGVVTTENLPAQADGAGLVTTENLPAQLEAARVITTENLPAEMQAAGVVTTDSLLHALSSTPSNSSSALNIHAKTLIHRFLCGEDRKLFSLHLSAALFCAATALLWETMWRAKRRPSSLPSGMGGDVSVPVDLQPRLAPVIPGTRHHITEPTIPTTHSESSFESPPSPCFCVQVCPRCPEGYSHFHARFYIRLLRHHTYLRIPFNRSQGHVDPRLQTPWSKNRPSCARPSRRTRRTSRTSSRPSAPPSHPTMPTSPRSSQGPEQRRTALVDVAVVHCADSCTQSKTAQNFVRFLQMNPIHFRINRGDDIPRPLSHHHPYRKPSTRPRGRIRGRTGRRERCFAVITHLQGGKEAEEQRGGDGDRGRGRERGRERKRKRVRVREEMEMEREREENLLLLALRIFSKDFISPIARQYIREARVATRTATIESTFAIAAGWMHDHDLRTLRRQNRGDYRIAIKEGLAEVKGAMDKLSRYPETANSKKSPDARKTANLQNGEEVLEGCFWKDAVGRADVETVQGRVTVKEVIAIHFGFSHVISQAAFLPPIGACKFYDR
ncbi:hypothetical protein DFH27DRAFT_637330 [Peziza echinospora]|nr:hypothetical protein DFH27DRAFT_637330 [Peziza echinospora]